MITYVSLFVCIAGLVIWGLAPGKAAEAGHDMFWCGMLVFLFSVGGQSVKLF